MNDDDLDRRLRAYSQQWRDAHPLADETDVHVEPRPPRRDRRVLALAATAVVLVVAVGVVVAVRSSGSSGTGRIATEPSTSSAPSTSSTTGPAPPLVTGTTDLPVVGCPTEAAVSPLTVHAITAPTKVPTRLHGQLAIYSDVTGTLVAVAPRGWACTATLGADGSGRLAVYPPDGPAVGAFADPSPSSQGVTVRTDGACSGCTAISLCSLLPDAPFIQAARPDLPTGACDPTPAGETVRRSGAKFAEFADAPGHAGHGSPSGGPYPANGVAILQGTADSPLGWIATCTLPDAQHDLCPAVLDEFEARHPPGG